MVDPTERALEAIPHSRRDFIKKCLAVSFTAPLIASFGLDGVSAAEPGQMVCNGGSVHPVAVNDHYHASTLFPLRVPAPGVLANDTACGQPLTAVLVSGPSHGHLDLETDGSFAYRATLLFLGTDSFTYQAVDGTLRSNVATVTVTVGLF